MKGITAIAKYPAIDWKAPVPAQFCHGYVNLSLKEFPGQSTQGQGPHEHEGPCVLLHNFSSVQEWEAPCGWLCSCLLKPCTGCDPRDAQSTPFWPNLRISHIQHQHHKYACSWVHPFLREYVGFGVIFSAGSRKLDAVSY